MLNNKETYKIGGMTCASCAKAVERVTKKLDGVESSSVNIATEKLNIEYDKQKVSFDDIKLAIEKAGYKVIKENNTKSLELKIGGMTCAACAKAVERVTKKLDGVEKSNVNIATEKAIIEYDSSKVKVSDIKSVIEKAGYSIIEENKKTLELKIGGMTCAACAKAVERVTKKLDGVENSSVNIATEKANIEYDSSKIKISQIKSAIEKAGYSIIEEKKESLVDEDKLRKEKEITQEQAAEYFGVAGRTISRWETGSNMPDLSMLIEIAAFYNVEVSEIIDGERKSENMDNKMKETLEKVVDYNDALNAKAMKIGIIAMASISVILLLISAYKEISPAPIVSMFCAYNGAVFITKAKQTKDRVDIVAGVMFIIAVILNMAVFMVKA